MNSKSSMPPMTESAAKRVVGKAGRLLKSMSHRDIKVKGDGTWRISGPTLEFLALVGKCENKTPQQVLTHVITDHLKSRGFMPGGAARA